MINIREGCLEEALQIINAIPEFDKPIEINKIKHRLADKKLLILIAEQKNQIAGTKIGYALNEKEFYSWLGGILPDYRKNGLAQKLMDDQERWARENGYKKIVVKTQNKFRAMLALLVKNGYDIVDVQYRGDKYQDKIIFEKELMNGVQCKK